VSQLSFESLHEDFGARVRGVNLTTRLSEEVIDEVRNAIDTYSLLYFSEQPMNDEAHLAITRRLG